MPALALPSQLVKYEFTQPMVYEFFFPSKRSYAFSDMYKIANLVLDYGYEIPESTVRNWIEKADLVTRGSTARRTRYTSNSIQAFVVFCLCKKMYDDENRQRASREYHYLVS